MWKKLIGILLGVLLYATPNTDAVGGSSWTHGLSASANAIERAVARHDLKHFISGHDVEFPCHSTKNIFTSSGRYDPRNIIATRIQIGQDHAFVAIPRLRPGVPFTLSKVNLKKSGCKTQLKPYPCWSIQEEGNCDALQSVVDLVLDAQDILWVLDSGIVNTLDQPVRRSNPKVLAIDTKNNRVIKRIDLSDVVIEDSRLQHILVDYDEHGHSFVFISDSGAGAILVHDCQSGKNHRVILPDDCVPSKKDVMFIVLVRKQCGTSFVYFTYLHSDKLFAIRSEHLQRGSGSGSVVDIGKKPTASLILLGTDNGAGIFLRFRGDGDIYMWNSETCFKEDNFDRVQIGGDCRLSTHVAPGYRRFMWTIESNFQDFVNRECGCYGPSIVIRPLVGSSED